MLGATGLLPEGNTSALHLTFPNPLPPWQPRLPQPFCRSASIGARPLGQVLPPDLHGISHAAHINKKLACLVYAPMPCAESSMPHYMKMVPG
jgi:hypothetical protein